MPRTRRVVLPGLPHHVVQRGHNRQIVFAGDADYRRYLADLGELKEQFGVALYAYCLMGNHVHLLAGPTDPSGLARLMKALAGRATRYRNRLERRTGTLWEGRFRSSPVQSERYLLACTRYIELNPVRAGIVAEPLAYRWSSYPQRMGFAADVSIDGHACFTALGATADARRRRYAEFVQGGCPGEESRLIRIALQRGQLTGGERFRDDVERLLGRRIEQRGQGRPKGQTGEK